MGGRVDAGFGKIPVRFNEIITTGAASVTGKSEKSLGKSISIGALWMLGVRLTVKSLGLISSIVLARLLMPEDFGIVALAMSVYALIRLIRQFGFSFALIQNQQANRELYDTAWTLGVILSAIAAVILYALGPWAATLYSDERLLPVFTALALMFIITGFENVGVVDFQKKMTFDKVFILQVIPKVLSFVITLSLAFYLKNFWALVIGMLVNRLALLVIGYVIQDYRPRFNLVAWRQLVGFSSWLMIINLIKYLNRHGQNIVLAKFGGPALVGLVSIATEFASFVANEVIQPINTAAYPGYSSVGHDKKKLRQTFSTVVEAVVYVTVPGAVGIAALAPIFVPVLLGDKWLEAVELVLVIAYASIFISLAATFDMVFIASARQRVTTFLVSLRVVIFFPLMYFLYHLHGAFGVAEALLVSSLTVFPIYLWALQAYIGIPASSILKMLMRPTLAALAMHVAMSWYVDYVGYLELGLAGITALLSAIVLGAIAFGVTAWIIWLFVGAPAGVESKVISVVVSKVRSLDHKA